MGFIRLLMFLHDLVFFSYDERIVKTPTGGETFALVAILQTFVIPV